MQRVVILVVIAAYGCSSDRTGQSPGNDACPSTRLLVVTSDFTSGAMGIFDSESLVAQTGATTNEPDNAPAVVSCRGALLHRDRGVLSLLDPLDPMGGDRVEIDLNPATGAAPYATNPQRVLSVGADRAYVPVLARNEVIVLDLGGQSPRVTTRIDLSPFVSAVDTDGLVEASDAIVVGERAYIALGRYWFDDSFGIHFDAGSVLAVIDVNTDTLVDVDETAEGIQGIELAGNNPWRGLALDSQSNHLLVGSTGDGFAPDGGIEAIDLANNESTGHLLTEAELGAEEINGFAFVDPSRVYVLAGRDVISWDFVDGHVSDSPIANDVDGILVAGSKLYAWTRMGSQAGLRMFDATDGRELTRSEGPWTFGDLPIAALSPIP